MNPNRALTYDKFMQFTTRNMSYAKEDSVMAKGSRGDCKWPTVEVLSMAISKPVGLWPT